MKADGQGEIREGSAGSSNALKPQEFLNSGEANGKEDISGTGGICLLKIQQETSSRPRRERLPRLHDRGERGEKRVERIR